MQRILIYGMTDNNGGIESYIINYFKKINKENFVFDFITDYPTIVYEKEIRQMGGKIFFIPSRRENLKEHMKKVRKIVRENHYKVVYYNILSASAVFSVLPIWNLKNVKIIVHSHNGSVDKLRNHLLLRPLLNLVTDVRFACSAEAANFMFGKRYARKTVLINNAIDTSKYKYNVEVGNEIRKEFDIKDKYIVGHVGRLCYQKNTLFLLDIFHEVLKKKNNAVLLLVGEGEDRAAVEEKIQKLGIEENVILTGMRGDVERLIQAMDVFLFPSRFEGLSVVLIEAQAAGLKCITSKEVVSSATKITPLVEFVDLQDSAVKWAEQVLLHEDYNRTDMTEYIQQAGYDINQQVLHFENLLKEL